MMLLFVDEVGTYWVSSKTELVLGHVRGGAADLPFLADVGPRHARLERVESFRGGVVWRVAPLEGESVVVAGEPVSVDGRALVDGDRVELGVNLSFRFRRPDPGSTSAVLELEHGVECRGARGVVLFGEGASGRSHLRVGGLDEELELELGPGRLELACVRGVSRRLAAENPADPIDRISVEVPPRERIDLFVGSGADGRPPFALAFQPV